VVTPQKPAEKQAALPATLDITVELPGQVFVRGRGLDSEWKGRLHVTGTVEEPEIVGKLETVRGSFSFLGKSFQLTQGTITFDGGRKIDPALDITTQTNSGGLTAQVIIGGRAGEPTIRLTSTPEVPQDEILARILFNKGMGQITPMQGVQLAQAAATLASGGPGLLDRLRGKLGLDRLDIGSGDQQTSSGTSNNNSNNGSSNATISAGKYVASGVYVGVDQDTSGQSRAKVEIEVLPNVTVDTETGSRGSTGVGLNWKMDY
jgi:translocation and assembly module TamB